MIGRIVPPLAGLTACHGFLIGYATVWAFGVTVARGGVIFLPVGQK